jgi:hypothetical protein
MNPHVKLGIAAALATAGLAIGTAHAEGPFDGHWRFDATGAGYFDANQRHQCAPIDLNLVVTDGIISGSVEPHEGYVQQVTNGSSSDAWPLTGKIDSDGHVTIKWNNVVATGTAGRHGFEVNWQDECGQRVGDARPD